MPPPQKKIKWRKEERREEKKRKRNKEKGKRKEGKEEGGSWERNMTYLVFDGHSHPDIL